MSITHEAYLNIVPGDSPAPIIKVSQYDADFSIVFHLIAKKRGIIPAYPRTVENDEDVTINVPTSATVSVRGTKTDGNGYSANATLSGTATAPIVTVAGHEQMTASAGVNVYEITFYADNATKRLSTANFILFVEPAALDANTITSESLMLELNDLIASVPNAVEAAERAEQAAAQFEIDATLTQQGKPADAKKVGDEISDLKADLNQIDRVVQDELEPVLSDVSQVKSDVSQIKTTLPKKINQPLNSSSQPVYGTNGQVLRTKGDGSTEWATVGQPTDAQTAQAVSDWLDAHPDATTSVEDGSVSEQKLTADVTAKLNNIVSVKSYGAKGDGSTDDTAAIQRCIDENPHSTIFFPDGTYCISTGLKCYARVGGTYLFVGGATIKAIAEMTTMISFDKDYTTEYIGTKGGLFGIFGGRLDANDLADECLNNNGIYINTDGTYMLSFNVCGLRDTGSLSSHRRLKCDLVMPYQSWSEGNAAGIIASCGDSFFSDVQVQNCRYAVRLRKGGCIFSDCYFFSRTNTTLHPDAGMQGYAIYIENDDAVVPRTTFNNCYFDSNIYAIYSVAEKVWNIAMNNCIFFITLDSYFNATKVYLLGGSKNVNIRTKGLECYSTPTCDILVGRQTYSAANNKNFVIEQNAPNTNINNLLNIVNLEPTKYNLSDIANGTVVLLGGISNANIKNGIYKLTISYGSHYATFVIRNINDVFTLVKADRYFANNYFEIIIDQTPKQADALETVTYYPIYLKSKSSPLRGAFAVYLEPVSFKPASCYLYNDGYRTGSYTIANPLVLEMKETE